MGQFFDRKKKHFSNTIEECVEDGFMVPFVESLWQKYETLAPPSFQSKFLTSKTGAIAYSFFWEMSLACDFLSHGFAVKKGSDEGPDICLDIDGEKVWVECCVPTRGDPSHPDYKPRSPADGNWHKVDFKSSILRCTNILRAKRDQHEKWLEDGICKENEPFVIALNSQYLDLRIYETDLPSILGSLYGMGDLYTNISIDFEAIDLDINCLTATDQYKHRPYITKSNGSNVATTFFLDKDSKNISGVISSRGSLLCSDYPKYCYIQNMYCDQSSDFGFDRFMQTYDYDVMKREISMK